MDQEKESLREKDPNTCLLLRELEFNTNYIFYKEDTLLHLAATYGDAISARALIQDNDVNVDAVGDLGRTSLHTAASGGHVEVLAVLIYYGANIMAEDDLEDTPLHVAAQEAPPCLKPVAIKFLVDHGADVNAGNLFGETPLYLTANLRGSIEAIRALIENGANVNGVDQCEEAPLHRAARFSCLEVVTYLVEKGADINAVCKYNKSTPLHFAVKNYDFEIVKYLIDKGANIHAKNIFDEVPLDCAEEKRCEEIMEYLAEKNG